MTLPELEAAYDELIKEATELGEVWLELKVAGRTTKHLETALDQVRRETNSLAKKIQRAGEAA